MFLRLLLCLYLVAFFLALAAVQTHSGLYLHLLHGVGIGEGEVASQVHVLARREEMSCGEGAVAVDGYLHVFHLYELVACLHDVGVDMSYRQFSALYATHLGSSRLGDVEAEIG